MNASLWVDGLWKGNPALVKLLGLCPLLAVSNTLVNAFTLGLATLLTLIITNLLVSLFRNNLPNAIRIPVYVLIIASTVSSIEILLRAWFPGIHSSLGIFLPLIVTNCLIIGRAESFASRQHWQASLIDALSMGLGFLWVLVCLGALREFLGQGTLLADATLLFGANASDWTVELFNRQHAFHIAILPPGAFLTLGCLLALKNALDSRMNSEKTESVAQLPISSKPTTET